MKRKLLQGAALTAGVVTSAFLSAPGAQAQSADALLDKLVEKGVLSTKEAKDLREEADHNFTKAYQVKSGMPDWVTSLKFNGDFRLRYEGFYFDSDDFATRTRFRYRLRPGFTAVIQDHFEVGFRLTSSDPSTGFGGDPISGNTTFQNNGDKKFVYIDLAYAKWQALNNKEWALTFTGGKMENPFQFPGTEVFDRDYTPEGFAQDVTYRFNAEHSLKLTGGQFILDEIDVSGQDPALFGAQLRWNAVWSPKISTTLGGAFLTLANTDNLTTANVPNQGRGNTRTAGGALVYGYNPFVVDAGLTYTFESGPLYKGAFPVSVTGSYMDNHSAPDNNIAWNGGITFGKAGKKKTWQIDYRYTHLEQDAWYEEFTESDLGAVYATAPVGGSNGYRNGTNVKGHVVRASYSPADSLTLSVTYWFTELINPSPLDSDSGAGRLQVDAIWKF